MNIFSLGTMPWRCIQNIACIYCWVVFHKVCHNLTIYLLKGIGGLQFLYIKTKLLWIIMYMFYVDISFNFSGMLRSPMIKLYGKCIINFKKLMLYFRVAVLLHSHQQCRRGPVSLHSLQQLMLSFFPAAILLSLQYLTEVFICISLMAVLLHIFKCTYLPSPFMKYLSTLFALFIWVLYVL